MATETAPGTGTPDASATSKTADQLAADKATADAAAAAAAGGKTPEQLAADKATADAATKAAADSKTESKDDAATQQSKAPAKYELTLPDGGRLDASDLHTIEEIARTAGWSNEDAQAAIAEHDTLLEKQSARFLAETKADKDYGGDKLEQSQTLARQVIDRVRPPGHPRRESFQQFLNRGGAGNHLEVVSFMADLGKLMAEDGPVGGSGGGAPVRDAASVLYGDDK